MTDNGWNEYKTLLLDDRRQNEEKFEKVFGKLDDISTQLTEMRTQRRVAGWVSGFVLPAGIAAAVAWLTSR